MNDFKDDLSQLQPLLNYEPPKLPKLQDARKDSSFLKILPQRWKKNAKVITCIGLIGTGLFTMTACDIMSSFNTIRNQSNSIIRPRDPIDHTHHGGSASGPIYVDTTTEQELEYLINKYVVRSDLELKAHHGGSGGAPVYIVHLTEQEAFGIIRAHLEAAGLDFSSNPPNIVVETWVEDFDIKLYDAARRVGISYITVDNNHEPFFSHGGDRLAQWLSDEFNEITNDIQVGVFFNPAKMIGYDERPSDDFIIESKIEARPILEDELVAQVQDFIDFLIAEGILEP